MGASLTLLRAWASAGSRVKPSDTKIDTGWINGDQARGDWENERMYTRDTLVNAIAAYLNAGVPISDLVAGSVVLPSGSSLSFQTTSQTTRAVSGGFFAEDAAGTVNSKMQAIGLTVEGTSTTATVGASSIGVNDGTNSTSLAVAGVTAAGAAGISTFGPSGVQSGSGSELSALKKAGLTMVGAEGSSVAGARLFSISLTSTTWTLSDGLYQLDGSLTIEGILFESRPIIGAMISGTLSGKRWSMVVHNIAFDDSGSDTVLTDLWVSGLASPESLGALTLNFWACTLVSSVEQ